MENDCETTKRKHHINLPKHRKHKFARGGKAIEVYQDSSIYFAVQCENVARTDAVWQSKNNEWMMKVVTSGSVFHQ